MTASTQAGPATSAAYAPPRVHIRPPNQTWTKYPWARHAEGSIVRVVLNVRTGDIYTDPSPSGDTSGGPYYDPSLDLWSRAWGYERTPARIAWDARSNWDWTRTSETVAAQLARIAPIAQHLLDHLAPVPGTDGEWDWTPAATAAEDRIRSGVCYTQHSDDDWWAEPLPDRGHYGVVAVSELLDTVPDMADPAWATMTDAELDAVAGEWCGTPERPSGRYLPSRIESAVRDRFHPSDSPHGSSGVPIHLVRGRIDLRAWRAAAIEARTGMPATPAGEYLDGSEGTAVDGLTDTASDTELEQLAARVDAEAAHRDRVALVGTVDYLRRHRAAMRARARAELAAIGARHAAAAAELQRLSAVRAGLLHKVVAFREPPEWPDGADEPNYAELGRVARMTRQSAREAVRPAMSTGPAREDVRDALGSYVRNAAPGGITALAARHYLRGQLGEKTTMDDATALLRELADAGEVEAYQRGAIIMYRATAAEGKA